MLTMSPIDAGEKDAVLEREAEQPRLIRGRHAGRGGRHRDALQADHLAHDPAARVAGRHQRRIQAEIVGGHDLQVAEQRIGGGVAAGEEDAEPAQQGAEEGKQRSGRGERQSEVGRGTRSSS